jgi:hypothetical protein
VGRRPGPIPEDPEAICCLLVVNSAFTAKILYHYLKVSKPISSIRWEGTGRYRSSHIN